MTLVVDLWAVFALIVGSMMLLAWVVTLIGHRDDWKKHAEWEHERADYWWQERNKLRLALDRWVTINAEDEKTPVDWKPRGDR